MIATQHFRITECLENGYLSRPGVTLISKISRIYFVLLFYHLFFGGNYQLSFRSNDLSRQTVFNRNQNGLHCR